MKKTDETKSEYTPPERIRIEEASRVTAGMAILSNDTLGSGKHGGLSDDPDEPETPPETADDE
jgi:hypothetical protein